MKITKNLRAIGSCLLALALTPISVSGALAGETPAKAKQLSAPTAIDRSLVAPKTTGGAKIKSALPTGLDSNAARIRDLDHARGLREMKDLSHAASHMPAHRGSLADPAGTNLGKRDTGRFGDPADLAGRQGADNNGFENPLGRYAPALPSNRDKAPGFNFSPSANPRSWMNGSTSQQGSNSPPGPELHAEEDGESRRHGGLQRGSDGRPRVTGGVIGNSNEWTRDRQVHYNDGTTRSMHQQHRDGITVTIHKEPDGAVDKSDSTGNVSTTSPSERNGGINKTLDPNAGGGNDGGLCRAMPWVCSRGASTTNPNRVNPGRDADGGGSAPTINPGESIVVNPSMESAHQANSARLPDPGGARRAVESGTHVNPPGPND